MPAPITVKTYNFLVNQLILDDETFLNNADRTNRELMYKLKESLIESASSPVVTSPWQVIASSDGSTADLTDRWNDPDTDLVWSATNRSWILLRQPAIAGGALEILIDLNTTSNHGARCTIWISDTAFPTGGIAPNSPPTPPTEARQIKNASVWQGRDSTDSVQTRLHVIRSTDGEVTRVLFCNQQNTVAMWSFEKPRDSVSGWNLPYIASVGSSIVLNEILTAANFNDSSLNLYTRTEQPGGGAHQDINFYFSGRGVTTGLVTQFYNSPNRISGQLPMNPCNYFSLTGGAAGRHGRAFDLWWGLTNRSPGQTYPGGARDFVQFGEIIFPWDGSIPQLA